MVTIIQNYDFNFKTLGDLTILNKQWYAQKHNYRLLELHYELPLDDLWYWHNIRTIIKVIEEKQTDTKWLMWSDTDSLIMNGNIQVESFADEQYLFIASLWKQSAKFEFIDMQSLKYRATPQPQLHYMIHTGNFLIRNCQEAADALKSVYLNPKFRIHKAILEWLAWDEGALAIEYLTNAEFRKKWKMLSEDTWCTVQQTLHIFEKKKYLEGESRIRHYKHGDFIVHAMGRNPFKYGLATVSYYKIRELYPYYLEWLYEYTKNTDRNS